MQEQITIVIYVDTIASLSDKSLSGHLYAMDNSLLCSKNQGTTTLSTSCIPGQRIKWVLYQVDLQTPAAIRLISFSESKSETEIQNVPPLSEQIPLNPDTFVWSGFVPYTLTPDKPYFYTMEVKMGEGIDCTLALNTLSLIWNENPEVQELEMKGIESTPNTITQ